jgi:hypothetical protein
MVMPRFRVPILVACLLLPASLRAQTDRSGLDCIYRGAALADLEIAWEMDRAPHTAGVAEEAALDRDASASRACAAQHHWQDSRTVIALTYAVARAGLDAAVRELGRRGISPNIVDLVAADIGERGRTALGGGAPSDRDFELVATAVAANLARTHAPVTSGSPELAEVDRLIARGLHAMLIRDRAVAAFARP